MNPGFDPWLFAFRILKSDMLSKNGFGVKLLEENDWDDVVSLFIFDGMHVAYENALHERREAEAEKAKNRAAVQGKGGR